MVDARRIWLHGLAAVGIAVAINLLLVFAGRPLLDIPSEFQPVSAGPVVFFTTVGLVAATAVFHAYARWTKRPVRNFQVTAFVVLVLSFAPDIGLLVKPSTMPGTTAPGVALLMLMHIVAAVTIVGTLERAAPARPTDA